MTDQAPAQLTSWLVEPLAKEVKKSIERLCREDDVRRVSLMPDVHLAQEVCVGAALHHRPRLTAVSRAYHDALHTHCHQPLAVNMQGFEGCFGAARYHRPRLTAVP